MATVVLGISAFYHDSAAALLVDGEIIAAAQEERFTRIKQDESFPVNAIQYVLREASVTIEDVDVVAFYDKPFIKFERLLETYHAFAPRGLKSFLASMPVWIKEKVFTKKLLTDELGKLGRGTYKLVFPEHHLSHAASAFYPSPFEEAAILTIDGVGEWATTTISYGKQNKIGLIKELAFPHSIGLLYSAFTYYTGFKVNSGEYKLMGLAPYGNPSADETQTFIQKIKEHIVDIRDDGSVLLNMEYFSFATALKMTNDAKWEKLFGLPPRTPETNLTQPYMNLASAIQTVTEEIVFRLAHTAKNLTGSRHLVMAGGVALNCVANGKLMDAQIFDDIWVQPAAGDAGGALGAAYAAWYIYKAKTRNVNRGKDSMKGAYLGPEYTNKEVINILKRYNAVFTFFHDVSDLATETARVLADGKVVGWFQGRMEYGPRALGNRSILGDPRDPEMQKRMNLKIKYREGFRPFAPSVLEEDLHEYFSLKQCLSPYMLLVFPVKEVRRRNLPKGYHDQPLMERLYFLRSDVPSITHIDYSARVQSVSRETNPRYWELLTAFKQQTGYGLVVNTSFNVRGEPIVCTPDEAYRCFMRTDMDYLVINNCLLKKNDQQPLKEESDWKREFALD